MIKLNAIIFLVASSCVLLIGNCQIHYVPAQILIPTLNISHFNISANQTKPGFVPQAPQLPQQLSNIPYYPEQNKTYWTWNQTTANGDLIVGQIGYLDRLLFNQEYLKERRWWSTRDKTIEYPKDKPGSYGRHETITAIRCYNKFYDGLNSSVRILAGGIGQRYVKIQISSSWGKGFKYLVQIFGK